MVAANFQKAIKALESINAQTSQLLSMGIDMTESPFIRDCEDIVNAFLSEHYTEDGVDLIYWWLYEKPGSAVLDEESGEVINCLEKLWEYLELHHKNV